MAAIISQTGVEAPIAAPAPIPAPASPAPSAPAARQSAPQQNHAVRPLIDHSGKQVDPFGRPLKDDAVVDMANIDDFMAGGRAKPTKQVEPNDEDEAAAPAPTDAKKTDDPPKEPDSPFAEPPAPAAPAATTTKRDYSQLPPEIAAVAKKLPNQVFEHLTNTYKKFQADLEAERATVEQLKVERDAASTKATFDHPDAYQIDSNYRAIVQNYGRAQLESNHYTEQIAKIDQGEAWSYISGYDQAGNPQYVEVPAAADGRVDYGSRAKIIAGLTQLNAQQQQLRAQAQQIQHEYANSAQTVQQHYVEAQKRLFPNLDPTKLTDETEKKAYEYAIKALPPTEQRRPSAQMLALAAVTVVRMGNKLRQAQAELERLQRVGANARAAAPVRVAPQPATIDDSDPEISLDNPLNLPARY